MAESYLPDVVIDSASQRVYAVAPEGHLVALGAIDGEVVWEAGSGLRPVSRHGDLLAAWAPDSESANRFRISWLDPANGATSSVSDAIQLPDWVSVSPKPGRSFYLEPVSSAEPLVLEWRARSWYVGGARPRQEVIDAARRSAVGRVQVDRESAAASLSEHLPELPQPPPERPLAYRIGSRQSEEPFSTGGRTSVLAMELDGAQSRTIWQSWREGVPEIPVFLGDPQRTRVFVSLDRNHLFVCQGGPDSCELLTIYSAISRERLVELQNTHAPVAATVEGHRLYLLVDRGSGTNTERVLLALELNGGREIWSFAVQPPPRFPAPR